MKFIDVAEIKAKAGEGGPGMVHFRREKHVSLGGPDGGNGGEGGDLILQGDENLSTLLDFRYQRYHEAEDGGKGGTNNRAGHRGKDVTLKVPCGTVVYDSESMECVGEVLNHNQILLVCKGGQGGIGNTVFASSRNQAPTTIIPPKPGQIRSLRLELKMIADVGIIGSPNAGKSTLVTVISAARPKVADYPFTTLVPTLGVVSHKDVAPFVVADVPGLIVGASQGKGLGHDFLRHIQRTKILVHMIDGSQEAKENMIEDFEGILKELEIYDSKLLKRPRLTVLSKVDTLSSKTPQAIPEEFETLKEFAQYLESKGTPYLMISAATRSGICELLDAFVDTLNAHP
jgi:GTPase